MSLQVKQSLEENWWLMFHTLDGTSTARPMTFVRSHLALFQVVILWFPIHKFCLDLLHQWVFFLRIYFILVPSWMVTWLLDFLFSEFIAIVNVICGFHLDHFKDWVLSLIRKTQWSLFVFRFLEPQLWRDAHINSCFKYCW